MANYFKNTELASLYGISEATVRNWIKSTKASKVSLDLVEQNGRVYVAKNMRNIPIFEKLIEQNRKYRNTLSAKTVTAGKKLFSIFTEAQVYEIVRSVELHSEIPLKFSYFDVGVQAWDEYCTKLDSSGAQCTLRGTVDLLRENDGYLQARLAKFHKVNVIDIGVGNALPVKELLARLIEQGKLGRYIGLDYSQGMLDLAARNLREWFDDKISLEMHQIDIEYERFSSLTAEDYLNSKNDTVNLVVSFGSIPMSFRAPDDAFRTICESMHPEDVFVYSCKTASPDSLPEWYEHGRRQGRPELVEEFRLVYDLWGVDDTYYDVQVGFDEKERRRYARTVFKTALKVVIKFQHTEKVLSFEKGDAVTVWYCWESTQQSIIERLDRTGFNTLHLSQTEDSKYALAISQVRRS